MLDLDSALLLFCFMLDEVFLMMIMVRDACLDVLMLDSDNFLALL